MSNFSYGIITISDSCHAGTATDESGPAIKQLLQREYNTMKISNSTVPDDREAIEKMLIYYADDLKLNLILTTGGTGFAPRDVTPEATRNVIQRECPQLALAMALESFRKTQFAALSRAICGIRDRTLIVNFPGSKKAVVECFQAIQSVIPHAIELIIDEKTKTVATHKKLQSEFKPPAEMKPQQNFETSTKVDSDSSRFSEVSDVFSQSGSFMEEIVIEDEIFKQPSHSSTKVAPEKPMSMSIDSDVGVQRHHHVCPHKTAKPGDDSDRNSPFPMIEVDAALEEIFANTKRLTEVKEIRSPMDLPPFRASIKDGYAVKSASLVKVRKVIGNISAGDKIVRSDFADDECYKINTGAAVPDFADAILQIEDTKLLSKNPDATEHQIELSLIPKKNCDIRQVGSDLSTGELLFKTNGILGVPEKSILASVGLNMGQKMPKVAIISTGDELVDPSSGELQEGQIYDSNSTMLKLLLEKHGFTAKRMSIAKDDYHSLKNHVTQAMSDCDVIISSGGVSMGDKDLVKPLMDELGFKIHFGRVNVKPGKPMTFATKDEVSYFALPGNPVSAFVTFHVFVLPALRFMCGFSEAKSKLPVISVIFDVDKYHLDPRPEYTRARVSYSLSKGLYYAFMPQNQISSRLGSLINADVLLHMPGAKDKLKIVNKGYKLRALVINHHFISDYQP